MMTSVVPQIMKTMKWKKALPLQRKQIENHERKSRSSATEMIEFLKDYTTKREKVEEENINLLKSVEEKKTIFFKHPHCPSILYKPQTGSLTALLPSSTI